MSSNSVIVGTITILAFALFIAMVIVKFFLEILFFPNSAFAIPAGMLLCAWILSFLEAWKSI
jgi:hypothetical protein